MEPEKRDTKPRQARANDPVKRRWMILGGTIVALAAGGGGGAAAAPADAEGTQSAAPNVVRIDPPSARPAGTDPERTPRAGDAKTDEPGTTEPDVLAKRLGRFMG